MHRLTSLVLLSFLLATAAARPALAVEASEAPGATPLASGSVFPDVPLVGELPPEQSASLGFVPDTSRHALSDIKSEVLIVEIFSMYCPFCQRDALTANALHELVARRGLSDRIRIIGVGAGNSDAEVEIFRKKYAVPFPLFSDASFVVHAAAGNVGTPYFYVLREKKDGGYEVVHSHLGVLPAPEEFLATVMAKAGL